MDMENTPFYSTQTLLRLSVVKPTLYMYNVYTTFI